MRTKPTSTTPRPEADGPTRTCIGCRRPSSKHQMTRFVMVRDRVTVDETATRPGRGCYVCDQPECLEAALAKQGRRLRQALRSTGDRATVDADVIRTEWRRAVNARSRVSCQ